MSAMQPEESAASAGPAPPAPPARPLVRPDEHGEVDTTRCVQPRAPEALRPPPLPQRRLRHRSSPDAAFDPAPALTFQYKSRIAIEVEAVATVGFEDRV